MTEEQAYRISEWVDRAEGRRQKVEGITDSQFFEQGLALLGEVMANVFYLANIRRKGPKHGMETLKYELGKRVKRSECLKFGVPKVEEESCSGQSRLADGRRETGENKEVKEIKDNNIGATRNPETETRNRFVLREAFPFLVKDDCPGEFKVLVADMITAHDRYLKAHNELYSVANKDNEACFAVSKSLVENYLNNRKCWAELEHYKKTGEILGEHILFAKRKREKELKEMPVTDLMALYRNLPRNVRYYGKLVEDDPDNELTADRLNKKEWFEFELKVVRRLMDVREKKKKAPSKSPPKGRLKKPISRNKK